MAKWVYDFSEGSREMRDLLGGKGANVAEMKRIGGPVRVPDGFTITTKACVAYMRTGDFPAGLERQVAKAVARLEEQTGKRLGDPDDPLLVSVRSGARESMPGMMDTVLNVGLNDSSVEGLAERTQNERFAWDSYRRFVQMFGNVVRGIDGQAFEDAIKREKEKQGVEDDSDLDAAAMRRLTSAFKRIFKRRTRRRSSPPSRAEQLRQAIRAVFDSWNGDRAVEYRRLNDISDEWGTAASVQQMVFGNKGDTSGSGVAFSRDEITGAHKPSGDYLPNAQGEDVVSGVRDTQDISELRRKKPEVHKQLIEILDTLERHYKDMQDVEFTVEEGVLYMLQTRSAKRPAQAAVRVAVDMVKEGMVTKAEALDRMDAANLEALHATFVRPEAEIPSHRRRRRGVAGGREGRDRVHGRRRGQARPRGPCRGAREGIHRGRRRGGIPRGAGHPHVQGGQGLARGARRKGDGQAVRGRRIRAADRRRAKGSCAQTGAPCGVVT